MARCVIGGMTDYSHQSLDDIVADLDNERKNAEGFRDAIKASLEKSKANSYWQKQVPSDFADIVAYSLRFYDTTITELAEISKEIKTTVKDHHVKRLKNIADVAMKINTNIGQIWGNGYRNKQYGNPDFQVVEKIYCDTRDMAVNLLDIDNMAHRLQDYLGKEPIQEMRKNNPWISGSFYLFGAVVLLSILAVLTKMIHWAFIPIVVIGGILLVIIIGLLQLRNDDMISDKSFSALLKQVIQQLPLLKIIKKPKND